MQDLSSDIIGTNPTYPKIVNHDWLTPNPATYDNYPSDNNPVRIVPKLAELWNHENSGINLVPNLTVQQLGCRGAAEQKDVSSIIKEAKKAMMVGMKGKQLADHLRSRFSSEDIAQAKDGLVKLSEETGLLGNVYIDVSAFSSANEAEQFLAQHRNRLAQDLVINESHLNPTVIGYLASKFRKNVLSSVNYDAATFDKYKTHLVASGKIGKDFVIDSKETLRQAFVSQPVAESAVSKKEDETVLDKAKAKEELINNASIEAAVNEQAANEMLFRKAQPIIEFARAQIAKGKNSSALKEMLRGKYASVDLNESAKFLAIVASESFTSENIDEMVNTGVISSFVGSELKKLANKYPLKKAEYVQEERTERPVGQVTSLYNLSGNRAASDDLSSYREASVTALRKGFDLESIKNKLIQKLSETQADTVIADAMASFNSGAAGAVANVSVAKAKEKVVPDVEEKQTLPDPSTIPSQSKEIMSFFDGAEGMDLTIDAPVIQSSIEIEGLYNR